MNSYELNKKSNVANFARYGVKQYKNSERSVKCILKSWMMSCLKTPQKHLLTGVEFTINQTPFKTRIWLSYLFSSSTSLCKLWEQKTIQYLWPWNFKELLRNKLRFTWGWAEVLSMGHFVKDTLEWEFFWLRFWIFYYFVVSYA